MALISVKMMMMKRALKISELKLLRKSKKNYNQRVVIIQRMIAMRTKMIMICKLILMRRLNQNQVQSNPNLKKKGFRV